MRDLHDRDYGAGQIMETAGRQALLAIAALHKTPLCEDRPGIKR